jgi:hypothetical protein
VEAAGNDLALVEAVRAVQRTTAAGDLDALHAALCELRNSLVERLPAPGAGDGDDIHLRLSRHRREQLLHLIDELLAASDDGGASCTCLVRGAELRSLLIRHLRLESHRTRGRRRS